MLSKKIGFKFHSTFRKIAGYFEKLKDFRRADKVFRDGFAHLAKNNDSENEIRNLDFVYDKFAKRVSDVYNLGIKPQLNSLKLQSKGFNSRFCIQVKNPLRTFEE